MSGAGDFLDRVASETAKATRDRAEAENRARQRHAKIDKEIRDLLTEFVRRVPRGTGVPVVETRVVERPPEMRKTWTGRLVPAGPVRKEWHHRATGREVWVLSDMGQPTYDHDYLVVNSDTDLGSGRWAPVGTPLSVILERDRANKHTHDAMTFSPLCIPRVAEFLNERVYSRRFDQGYGGHIRLDPYGPLKYVEFGVDEPLEELPRSLAMRLNQLLSDPIANRL